MQALIIQLVFIEITLILINLFHITVHILCAFYYSLKIISV